MKKPLRYMLSVVLMLTLMLSMGTAAFAGNTDIKPPIEYVSYGIGLSDEPGVDKHGLGDNDITIDGVSYKPKTSEDKLYVHILDLAAAKLLRGCADEAKELGLDYSKLYIENGLIHVKEGIPSAEAEELKGKLDKLTYAAVIGVVAGDVFDVGNSGDVKLQVKVAGFVTGDGGASSPAAVQKAGLDVKGIGVPLDEDGWYDTSGVSDAGYAEVKTTTIYVIYGGVTYYGGSEADIQSSGGETLPPEEPSGRERNGFVGVAKAAGDKETRYFIKVVGLSDEAEFIEVGNLAEQGTDLDKLLDACLSIVKDGELADGIIIATGDDNEKNTVMTIKLNDGTPKREELLSDEAARPKEEPGDEDANLKANPGDEDANLKAAPGDEDSGKTSSGYKGKYTDGDTQYDPVDSDGNENIVEVDRTGIDTADVTVRDTMVEPGTGPS